jgi:DNA-directed RNA polymerase subunit RPC12/RpoP
MRVKRKVTLYCSRCGWEKVLDNVLDIINYSRLSGQLARRGREVECPKCGYPISAEPCILYPGGWRVLKEVIE